MDSLKMLWDRVQVNHATPKTVPQDSFDLECATEMAKWATQAVAFNDFCNRAGVLGKSILYYDNHDEAKEALRLYMENICQKTYLPRYIRRDIIFCASRYFLEPSINNVYDVLLNKYANGREMCERLEKYLKASPQERTSVEQPDPEALKLLNRYYRRKQYYEANAQYVQELDKLVDEIECGKYGI